MVGTKYLSSKNLIYKNYLRHFGEFLKDTKGVFVLILGSFIMAISINMFLLPNKIAPGGVAGIATVIFYLYRFPVGISMLLLNIPLFILGIAYLGGIFGIRTFFATIMLSVAVDITAFVPVITREPLLASIFGGVLMGVGLGLIFRVESTTGGSDLAAKIAHRFIPAFSIGQILLAIDFAVIVFVAAVFRNYELALYAAITLFVSSQIIDGILEGVDFAKAVFIISNNSEKIAQGIMSSLDRGVTGLNGTGMYTNQDRQILMCVLRRREIPALKSLVREIDEDAFVILTDVREVLGEGFKRTYSTS